MKSIMLISSFLLLVIQNVHAVEPLRVIDLGEVPKPTRTHEEFYHHVPGEDLLLILQTDWQINHWARGHKLWKVDINSGELILLSESLNRKVSDLRILKRSQSILLKTIHASHVAEVPYQLLSINYKTNETIGKFESEREPWQKAQISLSPLTDQYLPFPIVESYLNTGLERLKKGFLFNPETLKVERELEVPSNFFIEGYFDGRSQLGALVEGSSRFIALWDVKEKRLLKLADKSKAGKVIAVQEPYILTLKVDIFGKEPNSELQLYHYKTKSLIKKFQVENLETVKKVQLFPNGNFRILGNERNNVSGLLLSFQNENQKLLKKKYKFKFPFLSEDRIIFLNDKNVLVDQGRGIFIVLNLEDESIKSFGVPGNCGGMWSRGAKSIVFLSKDKKIVNLPCSQNDDRIGRKTRKKKLIQYLVKDLIL